MVSRAVSSWGNLSRIEHTLYGLRSRFDPFPQIASGSSVLPFGNGRSYGDSCLNPGGALLETLSLDRFMHFDRESGVLACEAGVLLADILPLAVAAGWFLPVVPGTAYVTVGGAIANDVHGKNHHRAGTFGCHVRRLELLRSNGERLQCSPHQNAEWFCATVGGLGLTGAITWAELQLRPVPGPSVAAEVIRFANLDRFFALCDESDRDFEYTFAWIDCLARGRRLGRGLLQRGNHRQGAAGARHRARTLSVPFVSPVSMVNSASLRVFNGVLYHLQRSTVQRHTADYGAFFFPLDRILHWNRVYGPRGFYQYQCVLPEPGAAAATARLLESIAREGQGSFLASLKRFGALSSPGMLSFPKPGVTVALDFPNKGAAIERLFRELDVVVSEAGGRLYPAKDARMPGALFRAGYPRWTEFARYIDPACSSSFWRRVSAES
ncbi:MAG TPA: FAD-binding oxidoreductase [Steroidobacteraceae bacterium]|nr:FAD-binding oxidoreductase [Steroidobacteraceae bacterium]